VAYGGWGILDILQGRQRSAECRVEGDLWYGVDFYDLSFEELTNAEDIPRT